MKLPTMDLHGRTVLVTGATRGLGYGMALALAGAGADVVVTSRTGADCERVAGEIEAMGRRALAMPCDVSETASAPRLVDEVVASLGRLDVLVNNAGTAVTRDALTITEEDWDRVLAVNLRGPFFLAQAAARKMIEQGGGKIINVASIFGQVGSRSILPYCVSKGGLIQMTRALALELARYNIQVNAVAPGYVKTPMNEAELSDERILSAILRKIPMRRLGEIEDIAGIVVYLASDAASYVTGAVFTVDGGWTAE